MTNAAGARTSRPRSRAAGQGRAWHLRWGGYTVGLAVVALGGWGCSLDSLLKSDQLPDNVSDPAVTATPAGALKAYYGSLALFRQVFAGGPASFAAVSGLLSDELRMGENLGSSGAPSQIDARSMPDGTAYGSYGPLQQLRGQGEQSIGLLTRYQLAQPALAGHLYALEGYSEVFLAELFCSGIPLSTLDYGGDYTPRPGSTTEQVFQHALALFDTAWTLAGDSSVRFVPLVAVGKARALLGLGEYAAAAAAVAAVPDAYRYDVQYTADTSAHAANAFQYQAGYFWSYSVADQEGGTGLDYLTSQDPRSQATLFATNQYGFPDYFPTKYASDGSSPVTLASGMEARLIEAEAALQAGDAATWRAKLNALRTDGTFTVDTQVVAVDNTVTPPDTTFAYDTLWHAGTGGIAGLAPLADPGAAPAAPAADSVRVDLLFRERALWLFLTGHRQGDLRRLIRQYGRQPGEVYPIGTYPDIRYVYGGDVTMPIPVEEQITNPLFTGCASRGA